MGSVLRRGRCNGAERVCVSRLALKKPPDCFKDGTAVMEVYWVTKYP